jgi:hypothetical protein
LEELLILGDTTSADAYLALADGVLEQATSHVVDYSATMPQITRAVFKAGIKAMPNKYLRNRPALRFYTSADAHVEYIDSLAGRETALGDSRITNKRFYPRQEVAYGVPVVPAALMPDSNYLFTWPKNLILGVQRQIMIESDRDIRARVLIVVLTMRIDVQYEEEDSVVKCLGLNPNDLTTTTA